MLTGLKRRGARWYIRRRVPADIAEAWGHREANRALGTSDYKTARLLLPEAWNKLDAEFAAVRAARVPKPAQLAKRPLDPVQRAAVALRSLQRRRDEAAEAGRLEEFMQTQRETLGDLQDILSGREPPTNSLLAHEAHRNAVQALLTGEGAMALGAALAERTTAEDDGENPLISELHARWSKDQDRPPSTVKGMDRAVKRFIQVIGDRRIKAISRRDLTIFTDKMREPGVVTDKGVTIPSMNTTLSLLGALFGFAVKRDLIENNPARGTQQKDDRRAREKRREFDPTALKAIFSSAIYEADERPEGGAGEAVYWLPLLALYTGARITELCQLLPGDVVQEGYADLTATSQKAWVIRIEHNLEKGQRVKTEGSERRIPVHPDLVELGFVSYVQAQAGKSRLFSDLKPNPKDGDVSGNWGRWFGRHLRNTCGVADRKMTFHSFRHTFKHHMRMCEIPKAINDALTGHETRDAADAYGGLSYPLHPLVEGLRRYRVDGFTLPQPPPAFRITQPSIGEP